MRHNYWLYAEAFSPDECKYIRECLDDAPVFGVDHEAKLITKTSEVKTVGLYSMRDVLSRMHEMVHSTNNGQFGFDLYQSTGYDILNYNKYRAEKSGEYKWHYDAISDSPRDIKLTACLNLSPGPYEGGKFEMFINEPRHIKEYDKPGSLIIFLPWINHRVTPVTQGERHSLTWFFSGPSLR